MRTPRLFANQVLIANQSITLDGPKAHYLRNVLRLKSSQPITLFNGRGGEYEGVIQEVTRDSVRIQLSSFVDQDRESSLTTQLGLSVIKRDLMDTAIQKATELGVTEITPLRSAFGSVPEKSLDKRSHHWRETTRSASEQCERNIPPLLNEVVGIENWIDSVTADLCLVMHPGEYSGFRDLSLDVPIAPKSIAILTGPEGGLSESEINQALARGFKAISLGPRILRAETAPLALLSLVQAQWGDY